MRKGREKLGEVAEGNYNPDISVRKIKNKVNIYV